MMKHQKLIFLVMAICFAAASSVAQEESKYPAFNPVTGYAAFNFGQLVHVADTSDNKWSHNWVQNGLALFETNVQVSDKWSVAAGMGVFIYFPLQATPDQHSQVTKFLFPFITQAQATGALFGPDNPALNITAGLFGHRTNPYVQNLGEYLLRGPVYPGCVMSGFENAGVTLLGLRASSSLFESLNQNLLIFSELEMKPYYDFSLAYTADFTLAKAFTLGAGANFYHLISVDERVTTPEDLYPPAIDSTGHDKWRYIDPSSGDTLAYTHRGIKLMARLAIDPKKLFSPKYLGDNDLVLYSEAAVIGVKDYPYVYDNIAERIPVMVGFNIPTFKLLDVMSFEFEWYGCTYRNDYRALREQLSPVPVAFDSAADVSADDMKWSLYLSKVLAGHICLSGQVANDHFRSGGTWFYPERNYEAFTTLSDWYFMLKFGYFF